MLEKILYVIMCIGIIIAVDTAVLYYCCETIGHYIIAVGFLMFVDAGVLILFFCL